jgi:hypothetical protein
VRIEHSLYRLGEAVITAWINGITCAGILNAPLEVTEVAGDNRQPTSHVVEILDWQIPVKLPKWLPQTHADIILRKDGHQIRVVDPCDMFNPVTGSQIMEERMFRPIDSKRESLTRMLSVESSTILSTLQHASPPINSAYVDEPKLIRVTKLTFISGCHRLQREIPEECHI